MKKILLAILLLPLITFSQEDLLNEIDTVSTDSQFEKAAFKGLKIVNFESTKLAYKKQLYFVVSHRFGSVKRGIEDFFGLDQALTRLNFIYGITDDINIGVSRSSYQRTYEGSLKYRLVGQKNNGFPVTIVGYNSITANTSLSKEIFPKLEAKHRLAYVSQLLISRKFNNNFSLQLIPTFFHENLVKIDGQNNSQYVLGIGGRHKLSKRWSVNIDYGWHLNRIENSPFKNPLSIGFDLETGGHVFQLHFTNAQPMNANGFLGEGIGDWGEGDVFFGFNLSRVF
ncbi:DUF5777 family beta-barrel protein [Aureibaculum sp. 2210JD6-5]|uniref:DUF5777 family beta-barrel protein n=1 Tax=Aureibaculum sp. 2210JD6-5 TaxID=3103957 RepID=UPI002AAEADED|nr:DUF5777 family beta-barrel protein [Aureibaculum sp. 2210JD6-5]MDY7394828.1 DUF5777 family beta-barrel protein [Aureibaculum sp. 2210JD6-5]